MRRAELITVLVALASGSLVALATGALAAADEPPTTVPPVIGPMGGDAGSDAGSASDAAVSDAGASGDAAPAGDGVSAPTAPSAPKPPDDPYDLAACGSALDRCEQSLEQASAELDLATARPAAGTPPVIDPLGPIGGAPTATTPTGAAVDRSPSPEEIGGKDQVALIVKNMKPSDAAAMISLWDDGLAADVMSRLAPRISAPVFGAMTPETAARITARLASMRAGVRP